MRTLAVLLLLAMAASAAAQEREIRNADLPRDLERELLRMYDGGARRVDGPYHVRPSETVWEDLAVFGGLLRVEGRVEGDVAVVDGDVLVGPGGEVTGRVTAVGGEVRLADGAHVGGTITAFGETSRWATSAAEDRERDRGRWSGERYPDYGSARLKVRAGASYNRVEGLPIMFGPALESGGRNPLRLEALAIWRSETVGESFETDRMGYRVRAEQLLGGRGRASFGGSVFSTVDPMDRWQISDLEASLAAAVFHDDYRDHYERTGWSAFVWGEPIRGVETTLEYRDEMHGTMPAGDPWSLFDGSDVWRAQPLVAEGDLRSVVGMVEVDARDDEDDPWRGWYARLSIERPVGGRLTRPELLVVEPTGEDPVPDFFGSTEVDTDFLAGLIDLRHYMPVGWASQLGLRVVAGGRLDDGPLPSQLQHALGGLGTLPGFAAFHADCGARSAIGEYGDHRFYGGYGCDRFALGQVEYRGSLSLDFGFGDDRDRDRDRDEDGDGRWWGDDWWDDVRFDVEPEWVVFFDAGRGWAAGDPFLGPARDTGTLYDVGLGFLLDDLGLYVALPLNGGVEQEPRFFLRLGRRF
jgi:hypothetical protein